jgi:hypothetical protein
MPVMYVRCVNRVDVLGHATPSSGIFDRGILFHASGNHRSAHSVDLCLNLLLLSVQETQVALPRHSEDAREHKSVLRRDEGK